jgi:hypothetical protein
VEINKIAATTMARCVGPLKSRIDKTVETFSQPFVA